MGILFNTSVNAQASGLTQQSVIEAREPSSRWDLGFSSKGLTLCHALIKPWRTVCSLAAGQPAETVECVHLYNTPGNHMSRSIKIL